MQVDRLTHDLSQRLTRREMRTPTHDGIRLDFINDIGYTKDATGKANIARPSSLVTFARNSVASCRGPDGYIMYAPSNLLWNTHDITALGWGSSGATFSLAAGIAPDGTNTAMKLTETATNAAHFGSQSYTVQAGMTYTASLFVKYAGQRYFILGFGKSGSPFNRAWSLVDFTLGTVSTFDINSPTRVTNRSLTDVGNGWYRVSHTVLMDHTSTDGFFEMRLGNTGGSYQGDTTKGVLVWGPQLQLGNRLAAYIPSTSSASKYDQPRIEHDNSGNRLGYLSEITRTNQFLWSQNADNAAWSLNRTSVSANSITAPDNTITGDKVIEDGTAGEHRAHRQFPAVGAGTMVNMSVFAKAGERTKIALRILDNAIPTDGAGVIFDLSNGTIISGPAAYGAATLVSARITAYINGWYRCDLTVKANATVTTYVTDTFLCDAAGANNYTGDGVSGAYFWGAQFEVGQKPTSYIPTTTAGVQRIGDSMYRTPLGTEYNAATGTILIVGYAPDGVEQSNGQNFYSLSDNTSNNRISLLQPITGSLARIAVTTGGVTQALMDASFTAKARFKNALAWAVNDFAVSHNGAAVLTDNSGTIPTIDRFEIGALGGGNNCNAVIELIEYYPTRLDNATLIRLAT